MATSPPGMFPKLVLRSLTNNARISAWTLVSLATCAALVTLFCTATFEVGARVSKDLRRFGANAVASPAPPDTGRRSEAETTPRWGEFDAVVRRLGGDAVTLSVKAGLINGTAVAVVAADPQKLARLTPYWAVKGRRAAAGGECVAGRRLAERQRLQPGRTVPVALADQESPTPLRVVGVADTGDEDDDRLFVAGAPASDGFTYALVSVAGGERGIGQLQEALNAGQVGIELKPLRQIVQGEERVLEKVSVLFIATLAAVLLLTGMGVSASMLARVVERKKEFALLRALGARRREVAEFLLAESASLGVVATAVGFSVGSVLATVVVRQIFQITVGPRPAAFVVALSTTTMVAVLAGALACRRTLRLPPAEALRGE